MPEFPERDQASQDLIRFQGVVDLPTNVVGKLLSVGRMAEEVVD